MFRRRRVNAAALAVAAFVAGWFCISAGPSRAGDDDESHLILFSGRDVWRNGAFMHGGLLMAPGSIDRDGLLLKVLMSGGLYRYNSANLGGERVIGAETTIQVMPGFKIKRGDLEAKFFMGLDAGFDRTLVRADGKDHGHLRCLAVDDCDQLFRARRLWLSRDR